MARRLEDEDDTPEEKLEATKWKESWMGPWVRERSVEAAGSGGQTTTGWTLEEGQPRHRQRRPGQWWVMVVQVEPGVGPTKETAFCQIL